MFLFSHADHHHLSDRELIIHVIENQNKIMSKLADLQAAVTAEDQVIAGAITLINGLAAQIAALPADQAAIDALAADVKARSADLAAAVAAGTPTTPEAPAA